MTQDEIEEAYKAYVAETGLTATGGFLDFLKNVNWAQVIAAIMAIINGIPK
jgi:hypothetical protein